MWFKRTLLIIIINKNNLQRTTDHRHDKKGGKEREKKYDKRKARINKKIKTITVKSIIKVTAIVHTK